MKPKAMVLKIFVALAVLALTNGQRRYYSLEDMPETNFDCRDKILGGYYADPEANCQMFHVCVKIPGQGVQDFRFLCPNETAFDQENQICADSGDIDCESSGLYLENFDLYRLGSNQAKKPVPQIGSNKGTVVPLSPSGKFPVLGNNVYEDDDFYLQKSETGDRRSHSKDLLKGSSSSNFFNNRNKGKDLEDDDDDATSKKPESTFNNNNNNNNNQFKARPNQQFRPKTQYQSQFRKAETQAPTTTTQQPLAVQNQLNDKKRTKIAVRKLTRKRPEDEAEGKPTQENQQQEFSPFTTQVTQKFAAVDNSRYNTVNRLSTTPVPGTSEIYKQQQLQQSQPQQQQQQQQPQQQRFQNFRRPEQAQTTPAFFEPSPTAGTLTTKVANADPSSFSLLKNPIVAAAPNYNINQNRGSTNFQQSRPTTANYPSPVTGSENPSTPIQDGAFQAQQQQFNRQGSNIGTNNYQLQQQQPSQSPDVANFQQQNRQFAGRTQNTQLTGQQLDNGSYQQQSQQGVAVGNFQQNRQGSNGNFQQQQNRQQAQASAGNFQSRQQSAFNSGNFQQQQSRQQAAAGNVNYQQQNGQQTSTANGNFQQQQTRQQAAAGNVNYQQQNGQQTSTANGNFQQQQSRQQAAAGNVNYQQQNGQQTFVNGNFQQQQTRQQAAAGNVNYQQQQQLNTQQASVSGGNYQQQGRQSNAAAVNYQEQQTRQLSNAANGNFQQQQNGFRQVQANGNFQQNRQQVANSVQQNRQSTTTLAAHQSRAQNSQQQGLAAQQTFNSQQNLNTQSSFNGQVNRHSGSRQSFNRNADEFDEGENQEFLKTAPSNNFRPSEINSFITNNYKQEVANNGTKFSEVSTTKYITPTIVTTPRTTPVYDTPPARQTFYSTPQSSVQTSNFYSPTTSATPRNQPAVSSALPPASRLPQRVFPSSTPKAKTGETKDAAYDYAYYDDAGSFSEYDSIDHLGESDFSRTSQRAKSRLI